MGFLFASSLFAAVRTVYSGVARYIYLTGREGVLPNSLGLTHTIRHSPHVGSMIQTAVAVLVLGLLAILGLDSLLALFTCLTPLGALQVFGLMALKSFSVMAFCRSDDRGESTLATKVWLLLSGVVMAVLFVLTFSPFGALTGVSGWLGIALPALVRLISLIGFILAFGLAARDPSRFTKLGRYR